MSPRQAEFIWQHLKVLQTSLAGRGIPLHILQVNDFSAAVDEVKQFCTEQSVDVLFYNYQYEVNERQRDAAVEKVLGREVICQGFDDGVLLSPGSVTTGNHEMYKVFTPFSKAFIKRLKDGLPECVEAPETRLKPFVSLKRPSLLTIPRGGG